MVDTVGITDEDLNSFSTRVETDPHLGGRPRNLP
jgi:hypothetical protein